MALHMPRLKAACTLTRTPSSKSLRQQSTAARASPSVGHAIEQGDFARRHSGHLYPKLNPWAAGSAALAAEGEANFATQEKKNPRDFALWKACKPGEPSWESPWGRGRPGGCRLQSSAVHRAPTASPAAC